MNLRIVIIGLCLFVGLRAGPAFAACTLPAGADCATGPCDGETRETGHILYNADHKVHQSCREDGTWQALGPMTPDPCASGPTPGTVCNNGSVYAGLSPDGLVPLYTTPADAGQFSWNDGSTNYVDTAMQNCVSNTPGAEASCQTGEANTALLVGLGTTPSPAPYVAARHCDSLVAHGRSDWYLPAQDELDVLFDNRVAIGGFDVSGLHPAGRYWSSSESSSDNARAQRFSSGVQLNPPKDTGHSVRCVRR